jgi:hypothetical protein
MIIKITTFVFDKLPNNISQYSNKGEAMDNIIPNGVGVAYRCHRGKNKDKMIVIFKTITEN